MTKTLPRRWQITFFTFLFFALFYFVSEYKWLIQSILTKFLSRHLKESINDKTEEGFMARIEKRMKDRRENVKNTCRSLSKFTSAHKTLNSQRDTIFKKNILKGIKIT